MWKSWDGKRHTHPPVDNYDRVRFRDGEERDRFDDIRAYPWYESKAKTDDDIVAFRMID